MSDRPWRIIVDRAVAEDGTVLWPEYFTPEVVADLRRQLGTYLFSAQYQNNPLPVEGGLVRSEWIRYAEATPTDAVVVQGVDPAISLNDSADQFAHVTVAAGPDGRIVVVEAFAGRLTFGRQVEFIETAARRHHPARIVIETVAYQQALHQQLKQCTRLPVRPITPKGSKASRVVRLAARLEAGQVVLLKGLDPLEEQLLGFPRTRYDDLVDALAYAVEGAASACHTTPCRLRGI